MQNQVYIVRASEFDHLLFLIEAAVADGQKGSAIHALDRLRLIGEYVKSAKKKLRSGLDVDLTPRTE